MLLHWGDQTRVFADVFQVQTERKRVLSEHAAQFPNLLQQLHLRLRVEVVGGGGNAYEVGW